MTYNRLIPERFVLKPMKDLHRSLHHAKCGFGSNGNKTRHLSILLICGYNLTAPQFVVVDFA